MNPRLGKAFRPSLLQLEARDVPAWWAVSAPQPPEGTEGVTDGLHSGELVPNPTRPVDADGNVLVQADTAEAALGRALAGTITVDINGEVVEYVFGPGSVGEVGDERPFTFDPAGTLWFEDMAGLAGTAADWDYDDRGWQISVEAADAPAIPGGVLFAEQFIWTSSWTDFNYVTHIETTTVDMTVTEQDDGRYLWEYVLTNDSLTANPVVDVPGAHSFMLTGFDLSNATDFTQSVDWDQYSGPGYWHADNFLNGAYVGIGESATFTFLTPPVAIIEGTGLADVYDEGAPASGVVKGPVQKATTTTTQAVSVTWPDASRLPTGTTLTATVTGNAATGAPTGAVKFMAGAVVLGTAQLVPGANGVSTVTFAGAAPTVGSRRITAEYQGNAKYLPSTSVPVQVDLDVDTVNDAPFAPNAQPTGGNLTWANFTAPVPAAQSGAYTALLMRSRADREVITLTIIADGTANAQARAAVTAMQFRIIFDPANSWADANARNSPAALRHENLHLTMSEWIATRAAANRPPMTGKGGAQNANTAAAKARAQKVALDECFTLRDAYDQKFVGIVTAAAEAYDSGTSLPGPVNGGSDAAKQADWEANWKAKLQPLLANNGWN